jgi:predicted dehydrogenase
VSLPVAVIGVGAFGRNHARVYAELAQGGEAQLVGVVDTDSARARAVAAEFGTQAFASIGELLAAGEVRAASVSVPTSAHLEVARELMEAGVDVLIEKPLAPTLAEADEMGALAERTGCIVQAGHLERFNPAVRAARPLITQPMFFEVHRLSLFSSRALDVDVVLDLMVHDLDVVLSLVPSPIREVRAAGIPILSDKVDIANVRMEFDSGCVANLTASRVSTEQVRKLRLFQPHQYLSLDYSRQDAMLFTVSGAGGDDAAALPGLPGQEMAFGGLKIKMTKPAITREEPLLAELRSFLEAARSRRPPEVTLEEGRRVLAVALAILEAVARHSRSASMDALRRR